MTDRGNGHDRVRRRIRRVRAEVEGLAVVNRHQELLQALVLEMLDYVERLAARDPCALAGSRDQQAQWWAAAMAYRAVLESPALASEQARSAYRSIIDVPWPDVARTAARIARR